MKISVIIPTCNRNDLLAKCLESISPINQTIRENYEVIVSDDSKENMAKSLIEEVYPWVKWIPGPKQGPAANRNNGAKYAKGEWLVFLDDDCMPISDWLLQYELNINQSVHVKILEGCTKADRQKLRYDEEAPINEEGNRLWSCNFAIEKKVFNELNGFDETFPFAAMEDVDFYSRASLISRIQFLPKAIVIHPWRRIHPFSTFKKHLKSHKHFNRKYKMTLSFKFRWERVKIFLGGIVIYFIELSSYNMKGWKFYIEKCFLNFLLIFI